MKKTALSLSAIATLLATGCSQDKPSSSASISQDQSSISLSSSEGKPSIAFTEVKKDFYSVLDVMAPSAGSYYSDPATILDHVSRGQITFKVHPDFPNTLYLDFIAYASLIKNEVPKDYVCDITSSSIKLSDPTGKEIFYAEVDPSKKEFHYKGTAPIGTIREKVEDVVGTLMTDLDLKQETYIASKTPYSTISYEKYAQDFPLIEDNGSLLAPLSLFDAALGPSLSVYHVYDGNRVLQYGSIYGIAVSIGEAGSFSTSLTKYHEEHPESLFDLYLADKASLYLTMDNSYGLQDHRHIKSMSDYFDNLGYDKLLTQKDKEARCKAYFDLFAELEDDHTGISYLSSWLGETAAMNHRGQRSSERAMLINSLRAERNATLGSERSQYGFDNIVHYSKSGKTAYFYFDSFIFSFKKYDKEHRDEYWQEDSYFNFLHQFEEIKNHGGVENVIIDDSCNGGGTVGIAVKLLALLSKDNHGYVYNYERNTGEVSSMECRLDSNQDGKYDADDVYGDDFNISILTSPGSFSCGNLFPYYAKRHQKATILGKRSGGGECVVASTYLPSGRSIQYSSNTVIVDLEGEKIIRGTELGATPDIDIPYYQFYDIDALEAYLTQSNQ